MRRRISPAAIETLSIKLNRERIISTIVLKKGTDIHLQVRFGTKPEYDQAAGLMTCQRLELLFRRSWTCHQAVVPINFKTGLLVETKYLGFLGAIQGVSTPGMSKTDLALYAMLNGLAQGASVELYQQDNRLAVRLVYRNQASEVAHFYEVPPN